MGSSAQCNLQFSPQPSWLSQWQMKFHKFKAERLSSLAGRITRLKGQIDAAKMFARLLDRGVEAALLLWRRPSRKRGTPKSCTSCGSIGHRRNTFFLGHRSDLKEILSVSDVSLNFTQQPEAFGRTVIESWPSAPPWWPTTTEARPNSWKSCCHPDGSPSAISSGPPRLWLISFAPPNHRHRAPFTLDQMQRSTLAVYEELLSQTFAKELPDHLDLIRWRFMLH